MSASIGSYPKVYNLGHPAIAALFDDDVIVEEKIDGSQFSFATTPDGEFLARSKRKDQYPGTDKMFGPAVATALALHEAGRLYPGRIYRAEFLATPKHVTATYDRVPEGHLILFDVQVGIETYMPPAAKAEEAIRIGLECVPVLAQGKIKDRAQFDALLETTSILGGTKIEGVVIKQYHRYGRDGHVLLGKHVSELHREAHKDGWKGAHPSQGDLVTVIGERFRTEARWQKAVQHLKEDGRLECSLRDIGPLLKEVHRDADEEVAEIAKAVFWKRFGGNIKRHICRGLPEWYKEQLLQAQFAQGGEGESDER